MADNRDWQQYREAGTYWHRRLAQINDVHLKFSWDDAAVETFTAYPLLMWGACEDISNDVQGSAGGNQATYFLPSLKKIKEIHFTTTDQGLAHNGDMSDPATYGYHLSWNASTGVLTAAIGKAGVSSVQPNHAFSTWIEKNVK